MSNVVAFANDHAGVQLKNSLLEAARALGFEVLNLGTDTDASVDYPDFGNAIARAVLDGHAQFGVAICGSGIGISIAANRHAGIRAALVTSAQAATLARQHNDANILCLGARLTPEAEAKECVTAFLTTPFEGGRHANRVEKLG